MCVRKHKQVCLVFTVRYSTKCIYHTDTLIDTVVWQNGMEFVRVYAEFAFSLIKLLFGLNVYKRGLAGNSHNTHRFELNAALFFIVFVVVILYVLTDKINDLWMFTVLHYVSRWNNFFSLNSFSHFRSHFTSLCLKIQIIN